MSLSGHVHHLPHLLAYMILSFLLMTDKGDSTGVSLLPVGVLYTVQGVNKHKH